MLNKQEIEDVIVTAFEGGSAYWAGMKDDGHKAIDEKIPPKKRREDGIATSEAFARAIDLGAEIPIYDAEDLEGKPLGTVTKKSIREGIAKSIKDGYKQVWDVKKGNFDAVDADVLFQYFVMNELVYG